MKKSDKISQISEGQEIRIISGAVDSYNAPDDTFKVIDVREKAIKVERFFAHKDRTYTGWFPKSAVGTINTIEDVTVIDFKSWFENKLEGYEAWFFGCGQSASDGNGIGGYIARQIG